MAGITHRDRGLRVHRWLGLVSGLFAVALALSGVILACAPLIERIAAPDRYRISGETRIAAQAYSDAASRRLRPGERIATLALGEGSAPVVVTLDRASDRAQRQLFLDPPTAHILASGWRDGGVIGAVRRLHDGLFLAGAGRWIVGIAGIAIVLTGLSGFWAALARKRPARRSGRRGDAVRAWHWGVGFWSAVPVLAMTVSGIALALSGTATAPRPAPPVARPALPVARVVASAQRWSRGSLSAIDWPTERSADWTLSFAGPVPGIVKVADDSVGAVAAPGHAAPVMLSWARRLHDGRAMSWAGRALAVLVGLLALGTAATGLIAWTRRPKVRPARR